MRPITFVACAVACNVALGQAPDVRIRLDATLDSVARDQGPSTFRLYNPLGRTSNIALSTYLEGGLRAYVAERLQRIPGDADRDLFEEYYVEDEGIWRLGKQYLPFGSGSILRESVIAARGDSNLILEYVPTTVAICDNGPGLQRGIVGRIGPKWLGVSAAVGSHFGIAATALDLVRRPEESPGKNRGWKQVYGIDAQRKVGAFTVKAESVLLREPELDFDRNLDIVDASVTYDPSKKQSFTVGWTLTSPSRRDYFRVLGSFALARHFTFEPLLRYRDGRLNDVSMALRVRF